MIGFTNVVQTIPSIALLGFMIPLIGIGSAPAIVALFLYALLPIVRNTYTGITDVDPSVRDAGRGLGMTDRQLLTRVDLPLALPVIFAGVRTATVINVGVATLAAFIGAGGLGEFIFTGIALNNTDLILVGAIPAALLAVLLDFALGFVERRIRRLLLPLLALIGILLALFGIVELVASDADRLRAGLPAEFMERPDGWPGLVEEYGLDVDATQMNAALMYDALREGRVDLIAGYSTDGRIEAYDLKVLEDDRGYFPPYYAAPLVRTSTLDEYPELRDVIDRIAGTIDDATMRRLNYLVDHEKRSPQDVATEFLESIGEKTGVRREGGDPDIAIGGKNFTEQFILAEIYGNLIENSTDLDVELTTGLGGTQIVFEALRAGEIDLYIEYTGTGFLVLLSPDPDTVTALIREREQVYRYVRREFAEQFDLQWMKPIGFNNTYAIMVRGDEEWGEVSEVE